MVINDTKKDIKDLTAQECEQVLDTAIIKFGSFMDVPYVLVKALAEQATLKLS